MKPEDQIKALAELDGWRFWKSKHGYWNVESPDGEKQAPGFGAGWAKYDPDTGKKNEEMHPLYGCEGLIPYYLESRDAIVPVIEKQPASVQNLTASHLTSMKCWTFLCTPKQLAEALLRASGKWVYS